MSASTRLRGLVDFLTPGFVGGAIGGLLVGGVEGIRNGPVSAFAAAGFCAPYGAAAGLVASGLLRGLSRAWGWRALTTRLVEPTGGAPLLFAWVAYVVFALVAIGTVTLNAIVLTGSEFNRGAPAILSAALAVTASVALLVVLAWPAVRGLAAVARRIDVRLTRGGRRSLLRPRVIAIATVAGMVAVGVAIWKISIAPRIGFLDLGAPLESGSVFAAALIAVHVAWFADAPRIRRWLALGGGGLAVIGIACSLYLRFGRAIELLDLWGDAPITGLAIETTFDLENVRADYPLGELAPAAQPGAPHRNLVLITIDTVRADHTPVYGGPTAMPGLARFATGGAVFDWAFSPSNTTRRSIPPMLTGINTRRIRGRVVGWALKLDPRHVTAPERLHAAGYDTAGFFCCGSHFAPETHIGLSRGIDPVVIEFDGAKLVPLAQAWLERRAKAPTVQPFFLWIHLIEPHRWDQIYPPHRYGDPIKPRYDRVLEDVDKFLAPLLDYLSSDAMRATTYTIVTSDHGEGLNDDGSPAHSTTLSNAQTHVPWIVIGPGVTPHRIPIEVSSVGLAPTLLDLAGFVPPGMPTMDGSSYAPDIRGAAAPPASPQPIFTAQISDRSVPVGIRAVIRHPFKLIVQEHIRPMLYDIVNDPGERIDLAPNRPDIVRQLQSLLDSRDELDRISPFE